MAREVKTYLVRPETEEFIGAESWAATGEGLLNAFTGEEPDGFGTHGLAEANRISVSKNKKVAKGKWKLPSLAEGEIPVKVAGFAFAKSGAASDIKFTFGNGMLFESAASTTEAKWVKTTPMNVAGKTLAESLIEWEIESTKAAGGSVYAIYVLLTTETETSNPTFEGQTRSTGTATGGGLLEQAGNAAWTAGISLIAKVATIGAHGATAVTDTEGNTWVKDGEAINGEVVIQQWRSNLAKSLAGTAKIKIEGFVASAKVAINWQPVFKVVEVDQTGTATGSGTAVEVATGSALRASQGDLVVAAVGVNAEEASFSSSEGGWEGDGGIAKLAGLSAGGAFNRKPTEGATSTMKGTLATTGTWASVIVAYKVLANAGKTTYEQAIAAKTGTVRALTAVKLATQATAVTAGTVRALAAVKVAQQTLAVRDGATIILSAQRAVQQSVSTSTGALLKPAGVKVATTAPSIMAGTTRAFQAKLVAVSKPAAVTGAVFRLTISGAKTVEQAITARTGAKLTFQTVKVATSSTSTRAGSTFAVSGKLAARVSSTVRAGARVLLTVEEPHTLAALVRIVNRSQTSVRVVNRVKANVEVESRVVSNTEVQNR